MADDDYGGLQQPDSEYTDAQNPPSAYANKNAKTAAKPKPPAGKSPGPNGEVTILASYVWNPAITEKEEVQYLLDGKWHPWYADFVEITGVKAATTPGDFVAFMVQIAEYQPKSIKRLNFWTHSNKNVIGMRVRLCRATCCSRA